MKRIRGSTEATSQPISPEHHSNWGCALVATGSTMHTKTTGVNNQQTRPQSLTHVQWFYAVHRWFPVSAADDPGCLKRGLLCPTANVSESRCWGAFACSRGMPLSPSLHAYASLRSCCRP